MTTFRYRAARADGAIVAGTIDAATAGQAGAVIADRGLFPISLTLAQDGIAPRRASRRDLAIVFQSIAALVSAGVSLERAVASSEALTRGALRDTLVEARARLHEGASFVQALDARHGVVPGIALGMLRAGERGSQLPLALDQVARHLEQEAELVARVRQALAYPLLLAVVGLASILVIGTVIVPRFAELLGDLGQDLPPATRLLLIGSRLLSRFWFLLIPTAAGVVALGLEIARRPASRRHIEETVLALPLIGPVRLALATSRTGRALGAMLAVGMPLLAALDAAREAVGDQAVAGRLERARERVAAGAPLAPSLERESALAPSALQLVRVGESSGRLGDMARRAGDLAAQEAERGLKTLVTLVEPALIVAFGGLVAFVAAALLQAVYSIRPGG
ncbi:MAG TPA: type II secretion system F family protein [Gemmatimonadales bacterium]|nr:type II secretion system F family protein [Gemmatimonadales bacterium]